MKARMKDAYELCLSAQRKAPIAILEKLLRLPTCRLHGPEHHVEVGSALLTAYRNAGGAIDLAIALEELYKRASAVPGAACGYWGACRACLSTGQFLSIVTGSGPLATTQWGTCMNMTAKSLTAVAAVGGPRCCKRDSYLSVLSAVDFVTDKLNVKMDKTTPVCSRSSQNFQCIGKRCPFYGGEK